MNRSRAVAADRRPLVLVVDDDPSIRDFVRLLLVDEGYRVATASNGRACLEAMRRHPPDAIILDVQMPSLDGWGFRAVQLGIPEAREIPVVVITAGGRRAPPVPTLAPAALITKPFDIPELLSALDQALGPAVASRRAAPGDAAAADSQAPPGLAPGMAPA